MASFAFSELKKSIVNHLNAVYGSVAVSDGGSTAFISSGNGSHQITVELGEVPEGAGIEENAELAYLKWFHSNADFGPADGDVREYLRRKYTETTGKPVPTAYLPEDIE